MKKFIITLITIVAGIFIVDRSGAELMWWVNQHSNDVSAPKLRHLAYDVNNDVVLMGASRCNLHYIPSVISDSIGLSVYNGGIDGAKNIFSHYLALEMVLRHHKPQLICLEVMPEEYKLDPDAYSATAFFAPYIGTSVDADSVFHLAGNYWPYQISHLYRFNAKAVSNIGGLIANRNSNEDNGYIPVPKPASNPAVLRAVAQPEKVDDVKLKYVDKFIKKCKDNDIRLIFVVSPSYTVAPVGLYDILKERAKAYDIPFMDFHSTGMFHDRPDLFRDEDHLWHDGAVEYSSVFAHDLKQILQ